LADLDNDGDLDIFVTDFVDFNVTISSVFRAFFTLSSEISNPKPYPHTTL